MDEQELLKLDYATATDRLRSLTEVRFRLLAFVPTIAGTGLAVLSGRGSAGELAAAGFLGFAATLGIFVYELRNTELYRDALGHARAVEQRLGLSGVYAARQAPRARLLGVLPVAHQLGLALVYATATAAWAYLAAWGMLRLAHVGSAQAWGGLVGAVTACALAAGELRLDRLRADRAPEVRAPVAG